MNPWHDPIVEEIHQIRDLLAAKYGNNLHDIVAHYRAAEANDAKPHLNFPPKRPVGWLVNHKKAPTPA